MSPEKRSPSGRAAKETLLDVAARLFARKGYAATSTREIVSEAGVTKPVLYYYFKNKEGIYLEVMQRGSVEFERVLDRSALPSESAEKRLLNLCDQVFGLIVEKIEVVRLIYSIYYGPPQEAPSFDIDALYRKLFETVQEMVVDGIHRKELRREKAEDITWAILGALHVAMENELSHPERELGREGLKRILGLIFRGISIRRGRDRRRAKK